MTRVRKSEHDFSVADLATIDALLAKVRPGDILTRMSLESRRDAILSQLGDLEAEVDQKASVALFFGGAPVVGQRGIDAEFASKAVSHFQALVSKIFADEETGGLAQRGPVPRKTAAKLHITEIVKGSFGFKLEEIDSQGSLVDTALKSAVDQASKLIFLLADPEEEKFQSAISDADQRTLQSLQDFFELMHQDGATLRVVSDALEVKFDQYMISEAAERANATSVEEEESDREGELVGVLPEGHTFEFRLESSKYTLSGRVSKSISSLYLEQVSHFRLFTPAIARIRTKKVQRNGDIVSETYTLLGIRFASDGAGTADLLPS